jgi:hypothetical protein
LNIVTLTILNTYVWVKRINRKICLMFNFNSVRIVLFFKIHRHLLTWKFLINMKKFTRICLKALNDTVLGSK